MEDVRQIHALFVKNVRVARRNKRFWMGAFVAPLLVAIGLVAVSSAVDNALRRHTVTPVSVTALGVRDGRVHVPYLATQGHADGVLRYAPEGAVMEEFTSQTSLNHFLLNATSDTRRYYGALVFNNVTASTVDATVMYNDTQTWSLGAYANFLATAVYRSALVAAGVRGGDSARIVERVDVFPREVPTFLYFGPVFITWGISYLIPSFAQLMVEEKEKKLKLQLLTMSLRLRNYWVGTFVFHYMMYMLVACLTMVVFYAGGLTALTDNAFIAVFAVFAVWGLAALPLAYAVSFIFAKLETAQQWLSFVTSIIIVIPYLVFTVALDNKGSVTANYIVCVLPPYALYRSVTVLAIATYLKSPITAADLFRADRELGVILLIMLLTSIVCMGVVVWMDFGIRRQHALRALRASLGYGHDAAEVERLRAQKHTTAGDMGGGEDEDNERELGGEDEDVQRMREEVGARYSHEMNAARVAVGDDLMVACGVSKVFDSQARKGDKILAVDDVSIVIRRGEVFGLLGPNGAGKSTLISCLSGGHFASRGAVFIDGRNVVRDMSAAYRSLGVCPQYDALFDLLTVREHIELVVQLKGVPMTDAQRGRLIDQMDLTEHRDKIAKALSGGNKRKLCVALAFACDPVCVILDEPSSGMDVGARRKLWDTILGMKSGHAILLTTHFMEEAEALSSRIGIMVNGRMRCTGSLQHLKTRFGGGYRLSITTHTLDAVEPLQAFLADAFPRSVLKNHVGTSMLYELERDANTPLSQVFARLQAKRAELAIRDYSVSQTSLESVFLNMAAKQIDPDE